MSSRPLVSVIMNCLDGEDYLSEAIESVYAQDMDGWEIVFFDNNSTDRTPEIAASYDAKLRYFRSDSVLPLGEARNAAVEKSEGAYLAFLDCDDLWLPSKLSQQVAAIEGATSSGRGYGICYTDSMRIDAGGNDLVAYSYKRQVLAGDIYLALVADPIIAMSSALVDKRVFEECGGFDEKYSYAEEWDLWMRISRHYDVALVPQFLTKIRVHGANQSRHVASKVERLHLLSGLECSSPEEERIRKCACKEYRIRVAAARLLATNGENAWTAARLALRLAGYCVVTPIGSWQLAIMYLNPRMLKLFWLKHV